MVAWSSSGAQELLATGAEAGLCPNPATAPRCTSLVQGTEPTAGPLAKQPLIKDREGEGVSRTPAAAEEGPELLLTVPSSTDTVGTCQGHGDTREQTTGRRATGELLWGSVPESRVKTRGALAHLK